MTVRIKFDTLAVKNVLNGVKADIDWVSRTAINNTLVEAQQMQYEEMLQNFTIRNTAFLKYSVRLQFAKRGQYRGMIYIADMPGKRTSDIWAKFEGGGTKTPARSKNVAVPTEDAWPNRGRARPARNNPRNLNRSFVIKRGRSLLIAQRKGGKSRKQSDGTDSNVKIMYVLKNGVRIPDRLHFYATVLPVIDKKLEPEIMRLLDSSIRRYARR